jgi:hypothetical protein
MKDGLLYIGFIFLVMLTVSLNERGNDQSHNDIQTCQSTSSNPVIFCSLPESVISLKKIPCGQQFSDIFHKYLFESRNPDRTKMPVQQLMDRNWTATFMTLGQRVLIILIYPETSEDDHHLWNK